MAKIQKPTIDLKKIKEHKDRLIAAGIGFALAGILVSALAMTFGTTASGCIGIKEIKAFYQDILSKNNMTLYDIKVSTKSEGEVCVHNVTLYVKDQTGEKEKVIATLFSKGGVIFMQGYDTLSKKLLLAPRAKIEKFFTPNKTRNVTVDLYIMSMCPYGTRAALKFFNEVPSGINFKVVPRFIISASNDNESKCSNNTLWLPAGIYYNGKCYRSLHGNGELKTDIILYNLYHKYGYEAFKKVYSQIIDSCERYATTKTTLYLAFKAF